jgi:hypothetical protein
VTALEDSEMQMHIYEHDEGIRTWVELRPRVGKDNWEVMVAYHHLKPFELIVAFNRGEKEGTKRIVITPGEAEALNFLLTDWLHPRMGYLADDGPRAAREEDWDAREEDSDATSTEVDTSSPTQAVNESN